MRVGDWKRLVEYIGVRRGEPVGFCSSFYRPLLSLLQFSWDGTREQLNDQNDQDHQAGQELGGGEVEAMGQLGQDVVVPRVPQWHRGRGLEDRRRIGSKRRQRGGC